MIADHLTLALFDHFVIKLFDPATLHADDMIVVIALIEFVDRLTTVEMMPFDQPGRFELGQHSIDRGKTDLFPGIKQTPVDVFGGHVLVIVPLKQLQDLDPGERHFQARFFQFIRFQTDTSSLARLSSDCVIMAAC